MFVFLDYNQSYEGLTMTSDYKTSIMVSCCYRRKIYLSYLSALVFHHPPPRKKHLKILIWVRSCHMASIDQSFYILKNSLNRRCIITLQ